MENNFIKGFVFEHQFYYNQEQVNAFANATGDQNPIHLDEEYARKTIFKKPIIHGFLGGSVFSKVFGTLNPGEGTIYLKQSMTFHKPMFVDQLYIARFEVIDVISEKNRAVIKTEVLDQNNNLFISGDALIQNKNI